MLPILQKEFVQGLRGFSAVRGYRGVVASAMKRFKLEEAFAFVAPRSCAGRYHDTPIPTHRTKTPEPLHEFFLQNREHLRRLTRVR